MNTIKFITPQMIRDNSTFDFNVDDALLSSTIFETNDKFLTPIVGSTLMNQLLNEFSGNTLTAVNTILVENYIKPALIKYTIYEGLDFLHFKFTNKNISKIKSDTNEPIEFKEFQYLKSRLLDTAQFYGTKITNYLIANSSLYPLFTNPIASYDTVFPNADTEYFSGIYTGNNRRVGYNRFKNYYR